MPPETIYDYLFSLTFGQSFVLGLTFWLIIAIIGWAFNYSKSSSINGVKKELKKFNEKL